MKFRFLFIALLLGVSITTTSTAQLYPNLYRPNVDWQELKTPHFQIIYPAGEDSTALRAGRILEAEFSDVKDYLDTSTLDNLPVILNNYNDRSNGFVTTLNFRMEAQMTPIKGKSLNPRTGGWLENVLPHELVHAMHFEITPKGTLFRWLKPFSPDGIRSIHAAAPSGILEGVAVDYETHGVAENGGRGQYPYFSNQFKSVFQSGQPWSLPQMTFIPTVSRPGVRQYMGGYEFIHWLQETYGRDITSDVIERHFNWPFFFFGHSLKSSTGKKSGQLYDEFMVYKRNQISFPEDKQTFEPLTTPANGESVRRIKWLDDEQLVFYGSFYNKRPGFYKYRITNGNMERIKAISITEDFRYVLNRENETLIYGSYHADKFYDDVFRADLFETNIKTGETRQLTEKKQIYAPVQSGDKFWALQADGSRARWVSFDGTSVTTVAEPTGKGQIIAIEPKPGSDTVAVVMNKNGVQALWFAEASAPSKALSDQPDISFHNGSIYDPVWHPDGRHLMFSSDHTGENNLFELDLRESRIKQLTNSRYNAFEGAYNSDGSAIAFTAQFEEFQRPVVLNKKQLYGKTVADSLWQKPDSVTQRLNKPLLGYGEGFDTSSWKMGEYKSGLSWLRPRAVLPLIQIEEEVAGIRLSGTDRLQRHTYRTDFTYGNGRGWYDLNYQYSGFFPGFEVSVFNRVNDTVTLPTNRGPREFLLAEQGASFAVPIPITLKQNIYSRTLFIRPELEYRKLDLRDEDNGDVVCNDFIESANLEIFTNLNWNLQQNIRDMQPNTGWSFFTDTDVDLVDNTSGASNDFGYRFRVGTYRYFSPLQSLNQSLRLGVQYLKVQNQFVFDEDIIVDGFDTDPIGRLQDGLTFETRYLIPLFYPDDGRFSIPVFFDSFYLSVFSNTVFNLNQKRSDITDFFNNSRSIFGIGLRTRMKFSNLSIDFGLGIAFEPTRDHVQAVGRF